MQLENHSKDNDDVFDRLINHPFPQALGDGSASLDGFRYYMIVSEARRFFHLDYALTPNRVARHIVSGGLRALKDGCGCLVPQLQGRRVFPSTPYVIS